MECIVRYADRGELEEVNELRKMVNEVHVNGRPDIFRPGFSDELRKHVYDKFDAEDSDVIVALWDSKVCGYAIVDYIRRPESPYNRAREFYHIEEFGVDSAFRRRGAASAMVRFCRQEARKRGLPKIELDMWEFNEGALAFYEAAGFKTFRRYMELEVRE